MKIIDTYSTKGDSIEILLRQIGATKITKVKGYLYFIKFKIGDLDINYTYNINHKNHLTNEVEHLFLNCDISNLDIDDLQNYLNVFINKIEEYKKNL